MSMEDAAIELTRKVIQLEHFAFVRSLFQVVTECEMQYSWGWRVMRHATALGYLRVKRVRHGLPLKIESTERGRARVQHLENTFDDKWQEPTI